MKPSLREFAPRAVRSSRGWALSAGLLGASSLLVEACGATPAGASSQGPITILSVADLDRKHTGDFVHIEDSAIDWLVAADPRLAARAGTPASQAILGHIGTDAVLAEDSSLQIRAGSVDLFSFRARKQALREAARTVAAFHDELPAVGPAGSGLGRPQLERELIARIVDEELVRADTEERLGDASGDLVRAIVATWTRPSAPAEWLERDLWVSSHLLEIRQSLLSVGPRTGPIDLDAALYPLERLLEPLQFPRSAAAIAQVRIALDADTRAMPQRSPPDLLARAARGHLGVVVDPAALPSRLERLAGRLHDMADAALGAIDATTQRRSVEARARALLLVERACPAVPDSRVRSMAPPPERAAICGLIRSLSADLSRAAALVALHDDVVLSLGALMTDPPPRTRLLSHPDNEAVEELERTARERPVAALGVALAVELLYGGDHPDDRVQAWRSLGDAPLDIVARELNAQASSAR